MSSAGESIVQNRRLLMIDDDEMYLQAIKVQLQSDGYEVSTLNDWAGVTTCLRDFQPHLVLLDINMQGLSGDKISMIIKPYCDTIRTPIVFNSAGSEDSLKALAKIHGVKGYICKGNFTEWKNKVNEYLAV